MFLLLALACTGPAPDDSSAEAVASGGIEYYTWDYGCAEVPGSGYTLSNDAPELTPPAGRMPLFAQHLLRDDDDGVWRSTGQEFAWRDEGDSSDLYESTCTGPSVRGRVTIAYRADE
jgi:hypothetical protein